MMPVTLIDLMSVFRFPLDVWVELPAYHDYGFAVFRLKDGEVPLKVHPVEFEFPDCVHSRAEFDRMLLPVQKWVTLMTGDRP